MWWALGRRSALAVVAAGAAVFVSAIAARADSAPWPDGDEVARLVDARDDGAAVARTLVMELIDKGGASRTRVTRSFRRTIDGERRSVLFFESPADLRGTALLTWDDPDPAHDDAQWLYLPGLRKSRRIAISDRGRSFLGTDLSFEDMKNETRVPREEYRWRTIGEEVVDGARCLVVEAIPIDQRTARELGYGRVVLRVDAEHWLPRFGEYWDVHGERLKNIRLGDVRAVQGIWTAHRIEVENLQTGHRTRLEFRDVDYAPHLPDDLFTEPALARGAP